MKRWDADRDSAQAVETRSAVAAGAARDALGEALADHAVLRRLSVDVEHALAVVCGPRRGERYRLRLDWGTPRAAGDAVAQRLTVRVDGDEADEVVAAALLDRATVVLGTLVARAGGPLSGLGLRDSTTHARVFEVLYRLQIAP